jgi:hypothetical protein
MVRAAERRERAVQVATVAGVLDRLGHGVLEAVRRNVPLRLE